MSKKVTYEAPDGRLYLVEVPDDAPEQHYRMGILIGPPDLNITIGEDFNVRLHNELYARKIFTLGECKRRINEVVAAVQAAARIDAQVVMEGFLRHEQNSESDRI